MGFKFRYIKKMSANSATIIRNFENISSIIILDYLNLI